LISPKSLICSEKTSSCDMMRLLKGSSSGESTGEARVWCLVNKV
jgi:hypothetical protein